jgi:ankyrin repeat protein
MPSHLPDRPNLEQLKNQAKSLLRDARARDADALARFGALPAFANRRPSDLRESDVALHDAQSVIAREHGFPSWQALRDEVLARTMTFEAAVDEFLRCATGGAADRAERLLELHPGIATASLQTELVLGDAGRVLARLESDPSLVTRPGGPLEWEPLLYVCHASVRRSDPARLAGLVTIARTLCGHGANPNAEYHWNWHPELPRTVLWSAVCDIEHLPLAEALLEAGANPTDGVTAHIAGGGGNVAALELLARYGLNVDGIPGGVPPLVHMMFWGTNPAGPRWLLEHGANPNLPWGAGGESPLHVAARRWDVAMVDLLLAHGADLNRRDADGHRPYALAELHGNQDVAARLRAAGAREELSPLEQFVAACARGDRAALAMLEAQPSLRSELQPAHHLLLHRPAESGNAPVLEIMLACGFAPDARDNDGFTPLHRAAMGGHPDAVRVLLAGGADVNAKDGTFAATPLVCAVEGRRHPGPGSDHVGVARVLIAAGSSLDWIPPAGAPNPESTLEALAQLTREAGGTAAG